MEYELKFVYKACHTDYVRQQLKQLCNEDSNYSQNIVNSLYFDTQDWAFSMDKASSDYLKTKVRVRWYSSKFGQQVTGPRFLEIKRKMGSRRSKNRLQLCKDFDNFDFDQLTGAQLKKLSELTGQLEPSLQHLALAPAILVSYHRHRFNEPYSDSRISLDTLIRGRAVSKAVGSGCHPVALKQSVLEVKGKQPNLPLVLRTPLSGLVTKTAFSKYFECFQQLSYYQQ